MPTKYIERIQIPLVGSEINFTTNIGLVLCTKYERVVFLSFNKSVLHKKPYLEVKKENVIFENISIPNTQKWRIKGNSDYIEYRSIDFSKTKLILCKNNVHGCNKDMFYISLLDLKCKKYPQLIEKISKKESSKK
jgi:hypothetical protein